MSDAHTCPECTRAFRWGTDADSSIVDAEGESWVPCRENAYWKLTFHMKQEHPSAGFKCPRRGESPHHRDGNDYWRQLDGYRTCSYCGAVHPDELLKAIKAGAEIGPTDKSYKIYVDLPSVDPNEMRIISASTGAECPGDGWQKVTQYNRDHLRQQGFDTDYRWFREAPRGPTVHGKFYFQHLSPEQQQRFIDLYNNRTIKIGMPGYFYVLPFFMRLA